MAGILEKRKPRYTLLGTTVQRSILLQESGEGYSYFFKSMTVQCYIIIYIYQLIFIYIVLYKSKYYIFI